MLDFLLPEVAGLVLSKIQYTAKQVILFISSLQALAECPLCHSSSSQLHSYYTRRVADLPWADFKVKLVFQVRRFYCPNENCKRLTFAERLGPAIAAYARRTQRRTNLLQSLGLALGGEAGARLAKKLNIKTSPDTVLSLVRSLPLPTSQKVRVLGIDEFACALRHG